VPSDVATPARRVEFERRSAWSALTRPRSRAGDPAATLVLRALLASRLVVWAAGLVALAAFGRNGPTVAALDMNGATAPFSSAAANFMFAPAARWDSVWYLVIAHTGYYSFRSSGMFPLYPLLIRYGSMVFGSELIVGVGISLVSAAAAFYLMYRLVTLDFGERVARTTVLLLAFFPASLFFSAVYTESLFLLLSVGAIYAARLDRWAWAGLLAGFASAAKSVGVLLAVPLVVMYLFGPRAVSSDFTARSWWRPRYRVTPKIAWLALAPAGLIAFLMYLGIAHGQPFATFKAQEVSWGHYFAGPFGALVHVAASLPHDVYSVLTGSGRMVGTGDPISWNAHELIDLGFLTLALAGLLIAWRRLPFAYFVYALALLAQPLSMPSQLEPLESFSRYVMIVFPLFVAWAAALERRPVLTRAVIGISTALLAVFSGLWAMWLWVA
jgi:hypothetical protein